MQTFQIVSHTSDFKPLYLPNGWESDAALLSTEDGAGPPEPMEPSARARAHRVHAQRLAKHREALGGLRANTHQAMARPMTRRSALRRGCRRSVRTGDRSAG